MAVRAVTGHHLVRPWAHGRERGLRMGAAYGAGGAAHRFGYAPHRGGGRGGRVERRHGRPHGVQLTRAEATYPGAVLR